MELTDRNILVTGGAGGLGSAMAAVLGKAGGNVVILDVQAERGREVAEATGATFVEGDLRDLDALCGTVRGIGVDFDVLVNNAAVVPLKPIAEYSLAEYEEIQRINAHAAFALSQLLAPVMASRGGGSIVNLCSITLGGEWADFVPYVTSKGALLGMTRGLARELGPSKIRVNAISPGAIPTDAEKVHPDPEGYAKWVLSRQSLPYRGTPEDIAEAVLFLVSERGRFISGQNLHVNGGWMME